MEDWCYRNERMRSHLNVNNERWVDIKRSLVVYNWIPTKLLNKQCRIVRGEDYNEVIKVCIRRQNDPGYAPWSYDASFCIPA